MDIHPSENGVTGPEIIRRYVKDLTSAPGVYRMLDEAGNVLYVGKAKNLKNRVSSYANSGGVSQRIARMVSQTASMEFVTTHTEAEALLLEANMVKKLEPRYNILLRDDKSFPFIRITGDHDYPRIVKHRGSQSKPGEYYGPFASTGAVNATLATLQKAFLLRPCSDTVFASRTRPCLQYQIKRCSAPCVEKISQAEYGQLIHEAKAFLQGKSRAIQDRLHAEMEAASKAMEYEKAAALRDRIKALTRVQQEHREGWPSIDNADLFGIYRIGGRSCVQVFFFRCGQHYGNKSYFPSHTADSTTEEILSAFIGQFYQTHHPPKNILLSHAADHLPLLEEALSMRADYKVHLQVPKQGDKHKALEHVVRNAEEALERRRIQQAGQQELLEGVARVFGLESTPERIEVYDNSHIMGRQALGGMIVAGPDGFMKKAYRQFNIKGEGVQLTGGDDYAMLREVLTRRFSRLQKEDPDRRKTNHWPDLILIDGGAGHLSAATEVFDELGLTDTPYVCIAKGVDRNAGREWFHLPDIPPFQLEPKDPVLHYLQRLRDEAHRFAIGSHRAKRSKNLKKSELDAIPGIGTTRKKALLRHFGSARAVASAGLPELESIPGINKKTAKTLYDYFHS